MLLLGPWLLSETPSFMRCLAALPLQLASNEPLFQAELECEYHAHSEGRDNEENANCQACNAETFHFQIVELKEVAELVPCLDSRIAILRYVCMHIVIVVVVIRVVVVIVVVV